MNSLPQSILYIEAHSIPIFPKMFFKKVKFFQFPFPDFNSGNMTSGGKSLLGALKHAASQGWRNITCRPG